MPKDPSGHTDNLSTVNEWTDVLSGTFTPEIMRMKAIRQNFSMRDILFITQKKKKSQLKVTFFLF